MSRLRFFSVVFAALLLGVVCARPYASHRGSTSISRGDAHWRKLLDDGDSSSDSADTTGGLTGFNSQNLISDVVGSIGSDDDSSAPADASTNEAEEPTETEVDDNAAGSSSQEDNSAEATTETVEDNGTAEDANAEEKPAAAEDTESSTDDSDASEVPKDNSTDGSPEPTALFTSVAPSYTLPVVLNVTINIVYVQEIVKPKPEPKTVVVVIQAGDVGSAAAALAKLIDDGYGTAGGEAYAQAVKYFADEGDTTNTFNLLMATAAGTNQAITDGNDKEANKAANAFSKTLANLYGGGDSLTVVFNSFLSVALTLLQPVQGKTTTIIIYV